MRKTQTLFTVALLVLLGSMGAAQAQNRLYEVKVFTTPSSAARAGGENEMSGSVLLNFSPPPAEDLITVTLDYSVPLADDITLGSVMSSSTGLRTSLGTMVEGKAGNDDNDGNGTITITDIVVTGDIRNLLIRGVMLNVSGASEAVTVTVKVASSDATDFVRIDGPSSATVIEDILVGVTPKTALVPKVIRTRGTDTDGITASLTLSESFKGAFMMGNMLEIESSGIPEGASLTAAVTNNPDVEAAATDVMDPYAVVEGVKDGVVTVRLGGMDDAVDNEGDPIAPANMRAAPVTVVLALTLTANSDNDDISFPLDVASIMAKVTFTGDDVEKEGSFADAFTDYVTVFNIRPAQCELLYPVVTVRSPWDTAISVTNPAYEDEMAAGGLTFTFYGIGNVEGTYDTTIDGVTGRGLEADGTLSPGSTYQVLVSDIFANTPLGEVFADTPLGEDFIGHAHLRADYTNCSGLGWVTDFMGVNQAYTATVIDADTGTATE